MIHVNVWSQELDSGISISYKGCRNAPRYCHEVELAFGTGNAISFWATDLQHTRDVFAKALSVIDAQMASTNKGLDK